MRCPARPGPTISDRGWRGRERGSTRWAAPIGFEFVTITGTPEQTGEEPGLWTIPVLIRNSSELPVQVDSVDVAVRPWGYERVLTAPEGTTEVDYYADKRLGASHETYFAPGTIAPGKPGACNTPASRRSNFPSRSRLRFPFPVPSSRTLRVTSGKCDRARPGLSGVSSGGGAGGGNAVGTCDQPAPDTKPGTGLARQRVGGSPASGRRMVHAARRLTPRRGLGGDQLARLCSAGRAISACPPLDRRRQRAPPSSLRCRARRRP